MAKTPTGTETVPVYGSDGEPLFYTTPEGFDSYFNKMMTTPQGAEFMAAQHAGGTTTDYNSQAVSAWLYDDANYSNPNYETMLESNQTRWGDEPFQDPRIWQTAPAPEFTGLVAGPGFDEQTGAPYVMEDGQRDYEHETIQDTWLGQRYSGKDLNDLGKYGSQGGFEDGGVPLPTPVPTEPPPGGPVDPTDSTPWGPVAPPVPTTRPNLPQPTGGPIVPGNPPVDTSWDWDYFVPKQRGDGAWGGYDVDYQAFERYQPGMDSPWGMPDVLGGNEAFYQQQFVNLLRDEQGFRNRQREAQRQAQEAAENPYEAPVIDWSWAHGGRGIGDPWDTGGGYAAPPGGSTGGGTGGGSTAGEPSWTLAGGYGFEPGVTTNAQVINALQPLDVWRPGQQENMTFWLRNAPEDFLSSTSWVDAGDPNRLHNMILNDPKLTNANREWLGEMFDILYTPTAGVGPTAPPGYASPTGG